MQKVLIAAILLFVSLGPCLAGEKPELANENDRISYSVGYQVGGDFQRQGVALNPELMLKGVQDAMSGEKPLMTQPEMEKTLIDLKRKIVSIQQGRRKEAAEKNLAVGKKFLEENAKKEGVKTLPSGLQYKVIAKGSGKPPGKTDSVTVNYKGTLVDGTEFDSSYKRGKSATFRVDGVIAGWTEGLQLMKPGAKWQLFIPAKLAYGERGAGSRIGPNSALVFEVELISVQAGK